jgi:hypothetical protein
MMEVEDTTMNMQHRISRSANPLVNLKPGDRVIVCEDVDTFRSCHQICAALQLKVTLIEARPDGYISLAKLQDTLYADRHGRVRAVFVSSAAAECAREVLDLAWHDATLIVDSAMTDAA